MKALVGLSLSVLALSSVAQAEYLPRVKNVSIDVVGGGGIAAVQPYTMLKVTVNSCAPRDLEVKVAKNKDGIVKVKVVESNMADCRALGVDREYSLQISSDATGESYVLLNPIAPNYK